MKNEQEVFVVTQSAQNSTEEQWLSVYHNLTDAQSEQQFWSKDVTDLIYHVRRGKLSY